MWRYGFDNPPNYSDSGMFCGGFQHQVSLDGKCGICGDAWDIIPRPHEAPGGKYANGIITGNYVSGQIIEVSVLITANHKGYFVFKLCENNDISQDKDQSCFDKLVLFYNLIL
jgi:hypothetical protein